MSEFESVPEFGAQHKLGPELAQRMLGELSPTEREAVDNLRDCLRIDLECQGIDTAVLDDNSPFKPLSHNNQLASLAAHPEHRKALDEALEITARAMHFTEELVDDYSMQAERERFGYRAYALLSNSENWQLGQEGRVALNSIVDNRLGGDQLPYSEKFALYLEVARYLHPSQVDLIDFNDLLKS